MEVSSGHCSHLSATNCTTSDQERCLHYCATSVISSALGIIVSETEKWVSTFIKRKHGLKSSKNVCFVMKHGIFVTWNV